MQSRPSTTQDNTSLQTETASDQTRTTQHGLDDRALQPPRLLRQDERDEPSRPGADSSSNADGPPAAESEPVPTVIATRLSTAQTSSPSSRNRIAEYENASLASPKKKIDGPAFDVIRKSRKPGDKYSPIAELPNEILTHALAHLSPTDLSSVSLVSRRFHELVTTPHAWRTAFSRYFPGPDALTSSQEDEDEEEQAIIKTERRAFTRVTALASWRSEYILRTRLLRSLARGKPIQAISSPAASRTGQSHTATPIIMYNSQMFTTVNHLHASFGNGLNKRLPRFVHGADDVGTATSSDPSAAKVDSWGLGDPSNFFQFSERFLGDAMYGLGPGEVVGVPNVMDVSQPYGMVYGEGMPNGLVYYRFVEEMRGRMLPGSTGISAPDLGIPRISSTREAVCSLWMAKSSSIPSLTDGLIGFMAGSSLGVLNAYSLGPLGARDQRYDRGEITARWVLCPGVPIIGIAVDEQYTFKRQAQNRIWAVVLNALGELFYLTKFPHRTSLERSARGDDEARETAAWIAGRSVFWNVVEPTRRVARADPYGDAIVDGSYSPSTSWNGICLTTDQIRAETREVEAFVQRKPKDFQRVCHGWDMRRRMEVDFANDDGNNAGECIVIFETGLEEESVASVKRFTRCRFHDEMPVVDTPATPSLTTASTPPSAAASVFGGPTDSIKGTDRHPAQEHALRAGKDAHADATSTSRQMSEEWRTSELSLFGLKGVQITTTTLDCSHLAILTASEDPLLSFSGASTASSPTLTPLSPGEAAATPGDVPGQRARFLAAGTKLGSVLLWNMRAPVAASTDIINIVDPVSIIHTDSPQISCLALTALYLVHGGNDGLVQAWDPLGSSVTPIRTLNSRFSSRARRRLVQAQASPQGVGINLFAAGAICLDPDPTALRGMVSLGTHLRYWSYSSSAADQYRSHKRRLRRSERGSNSGGERITGVTRGNIKNFIANEQFELEQEHARVERESARLAGRFGTDLLGEDASEEELLAYAALLSQESIAQEAKRRESSGAIVDRKDLEVDFATQSDSHAQNTTPQQDDSLDADMAEAIRQSLALSPQPSPGPLPQSAAPILEHGSQTAFPVPVKYAKALGSSHAKKSSPPTSTTAKGGHAGGSTATEATDLEFALQLSLAEEQSRRESRATGGASSGLDDGDGDVEHVEDVDVDEDGFPRLQSRAGGSGKGKGRAM